jgi:dihydroneopterin aldolase
MSTTAKQKKSSQALRQAGTAGIAYTGAVAGAAADSATGSATGHATPRLRRVFVHDMEVVGSIGVYEHEKRYEQRILISADLWVRDDYDGVSDRLADVLDYGQVMDDIVMLAQSEHVNLNETLAERIARRCLADGRVERVRVSISKPDLTRACRSVGIEIERVGSRRVGPCGSDPVAPTSVPERGQTRRV